MVLVQKGAVGNEGNCCAVGSTASDWMLPDKAWWKNIWIFNPTDGGTVFT
jgi:hypothetical protein